MTGADQSYRYFSYLSVVTAAGTAVAVEGAGTGTGTGTGVLQVQDPFHIVARECVTQLVSHKLIHKLRLYPA